MMDAYVVLVFLVGVGVTLAVEHVIWPKLKDVLGRFKSKMKPGF
jgi:hypothetical protein